jgi:hypothetical protein
MPITARLAAETRLTDVRAAGGSLSSLVAALSDVLGALLDTTEMARAIGLMLPAGSAADKAMTKMVNLTTRIKRALKRA